MSTTTKRSIKDVDNDDTPSSSNPAKKRKLNEDVEDGKSAAPSTQSNASTADSDDVDLSPPGQTKTASGDINIGCGVESAPDADAANNNTDSKSADTHGWSFSDKSWVRQASNESVSDGVTSPDAKTADSPSNSKQEKGDVTEEKKSSTSTTDAWGGAWSNSNPDGTFKLNFNWGKWEDTDGTKIDLNTTTKVGWGSTAVTYNPDDIESDEDTARVVSQMAGEQDSGDKDDEVKCTVHCKVYHFEDGQYLERGKGDVTVSTYKVKGEEKEKEAVKGRILCRRDQILTNLINAPILKKMKFEKVNSFLRFAVVEPKESTDSPTARDSSAECLRTKEKAKGDENEDDDLDTEIKTYLLKATMDKSKIDALLKAVQEIQKEIS